MLNDFPKCLHFSMVKNITKLQRGNCHSHSTLTLLEVKLSLRNRLETSIFLAYSHARRPLLKMGPCPRNGYSDHLGTVVCPPFECSVNFLHGIIVTVDQWGKSPGREDPKPTPVSMYLNKPLDINHDEF